MAEVPLDVKLGSLGSFWRGGDGNVWVAGADGTNSANNN